MQITITADPKEIAALVSALQERQPKRYAINSVGRLDRQTLQQILRGSANPSESKHQKRTPQNDISANASPETCKVQEPASPSDGEEIEETCTIRDGSEIVARFAWKCTDRRGKADS